MIRNKTSSDNKVIDLTGPNGNAFYLLGVAKNAANQLGLNEEEILTDMMSGEYEHLIEVFEKHFGTVYTLLR